MEQKVAEYQDAVRTVVMAAKMLSCHDLPQLLQDINRADAIGPILDPTAWIRNNKAMHEDAEMRSAALPLWKLAQKLDATAPEGD